MFAKPLADKAALSEILLLHDGSIGEGEITSRAKDIVIEGVDKVEKFFSWAREEYRKRGVEVDFIKRAKTELRKELQDTTISERRRRNIESALSALENARFSHIPLYYWFADNVLQGKAIVRKLIRLLNTTKRETIRIKDLIDEGVIKKEDFNVVDSIMSNAKRMGRDLALLDIVN